MPRDLTELMERAVSAAPAEPHLAGDITRLAVRRQRRRTTIITAASSLAVVAVAGLTFGIAVNHKADPEPAAPIYKMGQHQSLSDVVASADVPGFHTFDYGVPSVVPGTDNGDSPEARYRDLDSEGRLLAMDLHRGAGLPTLTWQLAEGPGGSVHDLHQPEKVSLFQVDPTPEEWHLSFTDEGRLLWTPAQSATKDERLAVQVSDLDGSHAVPLDADTSELPTDTVGGAGQVRQVWLDGGRVWFSMLTRDRDNETSRQEWLSLFSFDESDPSQIRAEPAHDVTDIDVANAQAVWAAGSSVFAEDLRTGEARKVPVQLSSGCRLPSPSEGIPGNPVVQTNGYVVAVLEHCGDGTKVVVTDLTGARVTDVDFGDGVAIYSLDLGTRFLMFGATTGPTTWYADDLTTGTLMALGSRGEIKYLRPVAATAGDYVLWYDATGGHVGRIDG